MQAMQSLKPWNTFHLDAKAHAITIVKSVSDLCRSWQASKSSNEPVLILGEGSNVLFVTDFAGQVIINRIRGIEVKISSEFWRLHVGAGENWSQLVEYTLAQNYYGLENLSMIPGTAGAAPVQNIGAYGVEFAQVCEYVDVVFLPNGTEIRLSAAECDFGYRDSIFKRSHRDLYAITGIGLILKRSWQPVLTYADLTILNASTVTPREIYNTVCKIRRSRLPDPSVTGNAGSFFKSRLIVTTELGELLRTRYSTIPCFQESTGCSRLGTGWLIEQCSLKGFKVGGAAVSRRHALVLINDENATGKEIVELVREVRQRVGTKFGVWLEPEVRFIGLQGEIDAIELLNR